VNTIASVAAASIGVFAAMLACLEIGYRLGSLHSRAGPDLHQGVGAVEAAVFALLGLLLAFAFSGALSRLEGRRELAVREANAIGTAYLRIDLMPSSDRAEMRLLFRQYLTARLRVYDRTPGLGDIDRRIESAARLQKQIWNLAVASGRTDDTQNTARVLLPALNEMIDVTAARTVALRTHLPVLVFGLLIGFAFVSALLAGYAMSGRGRRAVLHMVVYAAAVSMTVYTVLDLDNPRVGLIRLEAAEAQLKQIYQSIARE
jgi:hypothetical protein